jgi:hypothetical protein
MFKPTTEQLLRECQEAERIRDQRLGGVSRIIKEYAGRWYAQAKDWSSGTAAAGVLDDTDNNPEPYAYSFVTNTLPALTFSNPAANVKARRVIGHRMVQDAMKNGLRAWIQDVGYGDTLEQCVLDSLFFRGVMLHIIEDDTRWADGAVRPAVRRIPFSHFFIDSLARGTNAEEFEFMGHKFFADLDDLQADPDVIPEALEGLASYVNSEQDKAAPFKKGDVGMDRKRICLRSVWIRRTNTIRIIAEVNKGIEIYAEREWYGPAKLGPYELFDSYPIPDEAHPLSPLIAVQDQVVDLQAHARATARSAAGRKTVIIVDGTHQSLPEDIKDSGDREVISVPGFSSSQVQQIELGGVTPQQYEYLGFLRARLDRHGGLTETARGATDPGTTATADTIANEAMNNRTEYLKARMRRSAQRSLYRIGWFLFHTTGIVIPVSIRDPLTGMEGEGLFFGGPVPGVDAGTWDDYAIEIEPYSMGRTSEATQQRRALDWATFVIQTAPMVMQIPYLRWQDIFRMVGEAMNQENGESLIIWELLGMMSAQPMPLVSQELGSSPDQPPRYFSTPGQGFKARQPGAEEMTNAPMVDPRRREFGKQYGAMGGGTQGPPGSAGTGSIMSGAFR